MGGTRSEIIRALGTPIRITKKEVINVHDPEQVDVKNVLFYDGLSIKIYRVSETGREIITGISITADEYKLKWGLSIGCTQDDLKKQFIDDYFKPFLTLGERAKAKDLLVTSVPPIPGIKSV